MELKNGIDGAQHSLEQDAVIELAEVELSLVGGGVGDIILG